MTEPTHGGTDRHASDVPDFAWITSYRGYDAESLAVAAGPGPVRRARKDVDAGLVSWQDGDASGGTVAVGDQIVQLDGTGPAGARCACPAPGLCRHLLAACLWLHDVASSTAAAPVHAEVPTEGPDGGTAEVLAEVLALEPAALLRAAGVAAQRVAAEATATDLSCEVAVLPGRLSITWPAQPGPVFYIVGAGFAGMISEVPEPRRRAVHLEALARARSTHGAEWVWPAEVRPTQTRTHLTESEERVVDTVQDVLRFILDSGLAHLAPGVADRLAASAFAARAADLPLLSRLLGVATGAVRALIARSDAMSESQCAAALAEVWVLTDALRNPPPEAFAGLRGVARRAYTEDETVDAVPLGASWWTTTAGARGLTLTYWDRGRAAITQATTGRAAGTDPGFQRGTSTSLMWGASIDRMVDGPFRLTSPRTNEDGSLSTSAASGFDRSGGEPFTLDELRRIALDRWSQLDLSSAFSPRLGAPPSGAVLLAPAKVQAVRIDEVHQHLVWTVLDGDGQHLDLRQPVTATSATRNKTLLTLPADQRPVFILVEQTSSDGVLLLVPTTVFVEFKGRLRLVPLDFPEVLRTYADWRANRAAAKRAEALLRKGHESHPAQPPATRRTLAERVCRPALDVLDAHCATGRPLSARQLEVLARQQRLASDVALEAVAEVLEELGGGAGVGVETAAGTRVGRPSNDNVGAVLRAVFVLGRTVQMGANRTV